MLKSNTDNITPQKTTYTENMYALLFENMLSGFQVNKIILNEKGEPVDFRILDGNKKMQEYTGFSIEEARGKTIRQLIPNADMSMIKNYCQVALTGKPIAMEYFSKTFNKYFQISVYSPEKETFAVVFNDITERKQLEETIQKSSQTLRFITDNIPAVVTYVDAQKLTYNFVNKVYAEMFNMEPKQLLGKEVKEILGEKAYSCALPYIQRALAGEKVSYENLVPVKEEEHWFNIEYLPEFDEQGKVKNLVILAVDIHQRKQNEDQIKNLLRGKELLLQEVHHRIKNNMSTISGLLTLQAMSLADQTAVNALMEAKCRVQSMLVLYNKLYQSEDFNNISANVYFTLLADEIMGNFPNQEKVKIQKDIEDCILDTKRVFPLGIILNELLTNIMKYAFSPTSPEPEIKISLKQQNGEIELIVADNGQGMDPNKTKGFGLELIEMLSGQLAGTLKFEQINPHGTKATIIFKL